VVQEGDVTHAAGHVAIGVADGIELSAQQVRVIREGARQRIVIEK
jgi:hypothetical protein